MNYIGQFPGRNISSLSPRNEGQLRSYDSCYDLRAWSHDIAKRDNYLKEWMKRDMPVSFIPISTLICIVKRMTCSSKAKATPRCHPQCKSKAVLDSICKSCNAMKDCFRNEGDFDKFFEDEEFETSHWPCEKCLEALKSIKMFWKIIVERLFKINISKPEHLTQSNTRCIDSVRSVARYWQTDMMRQAIFVKNFIQLSNRNSLSWREKYSEKNNIPYNLKPSGIQNAEKSKNIYKYKNPNLSYSTKHTNTRGYKTISSQSFRKLNRRAASGKKSTDTACECINLKDEIIAYKDNLKLLEEKSHTQKIEIENLKQENISLKSELQNLTKTPWWKSCFSTAPSEQPKCDQSIVKPDNECIVRPNNTCIVTPSKKCILTPGSKCIVTSSKNCIIEELPNLYDDCEEKVGVTTIKQVESEMIITMKNCKNNTYRYISFLQVIHKTNAPVSSSFHSTASCCQKEDPMELLARVQEAFGAIVSREMKLANNDDDCARIFDIDADCHILNDTAPEPSCSSIEMANSDSGFDIKLTHDKISTGTTQQQQAE